MYVQGTAASDKQFTSTLAKTEEEQRQRKLNYLHHREPSITLNAQLEEVVIYY